MSELLVIGAGCGRTGTASLQLALEQLLGGPCYHMLEVIKNPAAMKLWIDAAKGKPDWDAIFAGYKAGVDAPVSDFYEELIARYPKAKVVLTIRPPDSWYESVCETIWSPDGLELYWGYWLSPFGRMFQRFCKSWHHKFFGELDLREAIKDRALMLRLFEAWNARVRATVPPDRLLVHEAKHGWGPLCKFLGVAEPDCPYPRVNDAEAFRVTMLADKRDMQRRNLLLFAGLGGAILLVSQRTCRHFGALLSVLAAGTIGLLMPRRLRGAP